MGQHVEVDERKRRGTMTSPGRESAPVRVPRHFETFYRSEYSGVVALAYALSGSRWAAEDVTQEAFLRAHRDWDKVGTYDRPDSWVRRVATNLAFSRFRRLKAESRAVLRLAGRRSDMEFSIDGPYDDFWKEVRGLPPRQAQVVALFYVEDRAVADIADILGIGEGTVKSSLHKARASLAKRLGSEEVGR